MKDFNKSSCGKEVVRAAMTQLLLYYNRAMDLIKKAGKEGAELARDAVTVPSIMYECKRCGIVPPAVKTAASLLHTQRCDTGHHQQCASL